MRPEYYYDSGAAARAHSGKETYVFIEKRPNYMHKDTQLLKYSKETWIWQFAKETYSYAKETYVYIQ